MESKFSRDDFEKLKDFLPSRAKYYNGKTYYRYYSGHGCNVWDAWEILMRGYMKEDFTTKEDIKVHAFLNKPLEDMPLYINNHNWSGMAKWRLYIGK